MFRRATSILVILLFPVLAGAAVLHVPGQYSTIQAGLDASAVGDTVLVAPGTYSGTGNDNLNFHGRAVALIGEGGAAQTILDGSVSNHRLMLLDQGEGPGTLVQGFTLTGAKVSYYGGAILCDGSSPTLRELLFEDNHGYIGYPNDAFGAGLRVTFGGAPQVFDCVFRSNEAAAGGAVCIEGGGAPSFENVLFEANYARRGGAVYGGSNATFTRCQFVDNVAPSAATDDVVDKPGWGGAIYLGAGHSPSFEECLFANNLAEHVHTVYGSGPGRGGAVSCSGGGAEFLRCTFHGNGAEPEEGLYQGGTLDVYGAGAVTLTDCVLAGTTSGYAIHCDVADGIPDANCCLFWDNWAPQFGGACPDLIGVDGDFEANPYFCDVDAGDFSVAGLSPCLPANNACGVQIGAYGEGCTITDAPAPPAATALAAPFPNPFNPKVTLAFTLAAPGKVALTVYDASGRRVAVLLDTELPAGDHHVDWRGQNDAGHEAASGVYFVRMEAPRYSARQRMVLLR